jgi:hypothetical protein
MVHKSLPNVRDCCVRMEDGTVREGQMENIVGFDDVPRHNVICARARQVKLHRFGTCWV